MTGTCVLCEAAAMVILNGDGYCVDHVDDGFRLVARGIAILRGADPDLVERLALEALERINRP